MVVPLRFMDVAAGKQAGRLDKRLATLAVISDPGWGDDGMN